MSDRQRGKALYEISVVHLAAIIRGEHDIKGLPTDAECIRAFYDIERDRLILLMESAEFAPVVEGNQIPFKQLTATKRAGLLSA